MSIRTIQFVYDDDTGQEVLATELLDGPEEGLHLLRRETTARHFQQRDRYFCPKCKGPVWPCLRGARYFSHYAPADPDCEWYTGEPGDFREIDRDRFRFFVEGPLHKRLVSFIYDMARQDPRFEWAKRDREHIREENSGLWRRPDVWASFKGRELVFELQLSRTYLKDIVGREMFYRNRGTFMVWVFHGFDRFRDFAAAKDIYFANRTNALELDYAAEMEGRAAERIKLRAHWYGFAPNGTDQLMLGWHSRIADLDDLVWDEGTGKPYLIAPEVAETTWLRDQYKDWLTRFEPQWLTRHERNGQWQYRALLRTWERFQAIFSHRTLPTVNNALDHDFSAVLDQLYALRVGHQHFGGQNLVGATNTLLEYRRGFTEALVAVARAYGRTDVLDTPSVKAKIARNLGQDRTAEATMQLAAYYPLIRFLFPQAASNLSEWYDDLTNTNG